MLGADANGGVTPNSASKVSEQVDTETRTFRDASLFSNAKMLFLVLLWHTLLFWSVCAEEFPTSEATIAFHVTVSEAQLPLLKRFLSRIYHPDNLYLIDYAYPLSPRHHAWWLSGSNVHHRAADPYVEDGVSEVINILDGMGYFLDREAALGSAQSFNYFIHCTPADYPVVTPPRMRALLGFASDHASRPNFFHFAHESQLPLFKSEIDRVYYDFSLSFNRSLTLEEGLETNNYYHPDNGRRATHISRTEKHFVVNHAYVKLATDSMLAKRLLMSLGDASHVFERFFGSLAEASNDRIGKLIRSTSLRCTNFNDLDRVVNHILPVYKPKAPNVNFLLRTTEPCLFTGPFRADESTSMSVRDGIDMELLIAPGTQGKPEGPSYYAKVYQNLKNLSS